MIAFRLMELCLTFISFSLSIFWPVKDILGLEHCDD
jgi:hypothetical protein